MPSKIAGYVESNRRPVGDVKVSIKGKAGAMSRNDDFFSINQAQNVDPNR